MTSIDFAAIKAAVSLEQAKDYLGLTMKFVGGQFRSSCPTCKAGGDRTLAITPLKGFYCFHVKKGGDVIALVSHIRGISQREAAAELQERFMREQPRQRQRPATEHTDELQPLDHLTTDHPAIEALGLSATACEAIGIGYASKGLMRGRVAFPLRLPDGTLAGYMGLATQADQAPLLLFPTNLDERVTAPPKQEPDDKIVDFKKFYRAS